MLPFPPGADTFGKDLRQPLRLEENRQGAAMPGLTAEEIVGDYYESDEWAEEFVKDAEAEPDLDLPPLPPRPEAA
jgi:hypothetical protein